MVTGGAGFIGSHIVRLFVTKYPHYDIVNVDALTYAGNLRNLTDVQSFPNYRFERADIVDEKKIDNLFFTASNCSISKDGEFSGGSISV